MRSDTTTRWLVGLELFTALGAVVGTIGLLADGEAFMGGTVDTAELPFDSWVVAGLSLMGCNLVLPLAAVVAQRRHAPVAPTLHLLAGVVLIGWIVVQLAYIGLVHPLQPLMAAVGVAITALALRRGGRLSLSG